MKNLEQLNQRKFLLLDMYADGGQEFRPAAWRRHGLHTYGSTDTALILDVSLSTLRRWRLAKKGPLPVRRNGKFAYRFRDIYAFLTDEAERVGYTLQPFTKASDLVHGRNQGYDRKRPTV